MTKREILELIKNIMPSPNRVFNTPDEVVEAIWENIEQEERDV